MGFQDRARRAGDMTSCLTSLLLAKLPVCQDNSLTRPDANRKSFRATSPVEEANKPALDPLARGCPETLFLLGPQLNDSGCSKLADPLAQNELFLEACIAVADPKRAERQSACIKSNPLLQRRRKELRIEKATLSSVYSAARPF